VRKRGNRCGVRGVCVHDLRAMPLDCLPEDERREHIELTARRKGNDLETGVGGAKGQLITAPCDDDRAVVPLPHSRREQENLTFATAPASLRIDVQNRQQRSAPAVTSSAGTVDRCTS
jgi:hypothetical protein